MRLHVIIWGLGTERKSNYKQQEVSRWGRVGNFIVQPSFLSCLFLPIYADVNKLSLPQLQASCLCPLPLPLRDAQCLQTMGQNKPVFKTFLVRYSVTSKRQVARMLPQECLVPTQIGRFRNGGEDGSEIRAWEASTTTCQPLWETCPHTACCLGLGVGSCPSQQSQKTRPS